MKNWVGLRCFWTAITTLASFGHPGAIGNLETLAKRATLFLLAWGFPRHFVSRCLGAKLTLANCPFCSDSVGWTAKTPVQKVINELSLGKRSLHRHAL